QVDLVEDRDHFQALLHRGVAVGDRLRLDALGGVHHQQRAFAGGQRAADFVAEVHVPGGVDEVELVDLPVLGLVRQGHGLGLDGDAALALDRVVVEHLLFHLARGQAAAQLDDAVGQGRLAVVDVGDDREVANVPHRVRAWGRPDDRAKRGIIARAGGSGRPVQVLARGSGQSASGTLTATNAGTPPRFTSSITVSPGFTPARALSSSAWLATSLRPARRITSPGATPRRRAAAPSMRVTWTPRPSSMSSRAPVAVSTGLTHRPRGFEAACAGAARPGAGVASSSPGPANSASSSGARTTSTLRDLPSRRMPRRTLVPGGKAPMIGGSSAEELTARPSTLRITSPACRTDLSHGVPGLTFRIRAPRESVRHMPSAISRVIACRPTPIIPYWTLPVSLSC